jgi:ABC-type lipoprotein release transport system permease subunit
VGRLLLVARLAARDLRWRPGEAALLVLAIVGATTTLTLALVLRGVTRDPYGSTREATSGPDVVATGESESFGDDPTDLAGLEALADAPEVVGHTGPYPVTAVELEANGRSGNAHAMGRDSTPAAIDQPDLTEGSWVGDGGVVLEAAFADALGVRAGDSVTLDGQSFRVDGVAVTAASPPYPEIPCLGLYCIERAGVLWLTQADLRSIVRQQEASCTRERMPCGLGYVMYLKLADPAAAPVFVEEHIDPPDRGSPAGTPWATPWQDIRDQTSELVRNQRRVLLIGSRLVGLLAVASIAVMVGGRMANQTRRVGLLKAVGGTPGLAAAVLLAEYLVTALVAAAAGIAAGWLIAPVLTDPSVGLLGSAGAPPLDLSTVAQVTAVALGVAVAATLFPAVRASRTSTVRALADAARTPRRTAWLIAISARLPLPLLLGLRAIARRPRRLVLSTVSIFVTVSGIVAALGAWADLDADQLDEFGLPTAQTEQAAQVLLTITITLVVLAAVNAIFITSATVIDNRHSSALTRALGATPQELSAGLSAAQVVPAVIGAMLGIPGGIGLLAAVDDEGPTIPPLWQLLAVVPATVLVVVALTSIPARLGARRPVAETLQAELA